MRSNVWKEIGLWALTLPPAVALIQAGAGKLIHHSQWDVIFAGWGYPGWFWLAIGLLEVLGALALLFPRLAAAAAVVLGVTMICAVFTFVSANEQGRLLGPILLLPFLSAVVYMRRAGMRPILAFLRVRPVG
jgi:putative oxidoreductase